MRQLKKTSSVLLGALVLISVTATAAVAGDVMPPFNNIHPEATGAADYFAEIKYEGMKNLQAQTEKKEGSSFDVRTGRQDIPEEIEGKKNGLKAFMLSLAIPGAGQLYAGSELKAIAFAGLEAASWFGHIHYNGLGDDKTDLYENFADRYWSENRYEDYMWVNWETRDDHEVPVFTHHLPDTKTQQYYEMIGKYDQFVFGWTDVDPITEPNYTAHRYAKSQQRMQYEDMKAEAESEYDKSRTMIIVIMANHVISAAEAAFSVKRHNDNLEALANRLSVKAHMVKVEDEKFPMLTVTYKF